MGQDSRIKGALINEKFYNYTKRFYYTISSRSLNTIFYENDE